MESNEERVERLYPGVPVLNAAQTANVLGWDRKKIYNMAESLPFVNRVGGEVVISKRSLIDWLDEIDKPKAKPSPKATAPLETVSQTPSSPPPKKKVGRRRNSEKRANDPLSVFFAKEILFAMQTKALEDAIAACKSIQLPQDDKAGRSALDALTALPGELLAEREAFDIRNAILD